MIGLRPSFMTLQTPTKDEAFELRVARQRRLGLGISTEFGARHEGLDIERLRSERPDLVQFLEIGCDLERGVDEDARRWVQEGHPVTYHFLDLNLEEAEDLDPDWVRGTTELARSLDAAWLCGDAGLWHIGPRERGHGVLMPPVLEADSALEMGANVRRLRSESGLEVLPENPPAHVYVGRLHLLEYYARVATEADSGLLLDAAHLAVYQRVSGHEPLDALEDFPLERVVEIHVAGGRPFDHQGAQFIQDDHGTAILPDTWQILEAVLPRVRNLRAIVLECERNRIEEVVPIFERLREMAGDLRDA